MRVAAIITATAGSVKYQLGVRILVVYLRIYGIKKSKALKDNNNSLHL